MAEKRWTPGPWHMDGNTFVYGLGPDKHNRFTAPVQRAHDTPWEVIEATAKLIRSAPDLYEALEECVASLVDAGREHAPSVQNARRILARARGEEVDGG